MYSIKAVSRVTGLTVETLRAWERRYRVVVPVRDEAGRRVYRPEDVIRLRRLHDATSRGHPIGRLAHLSDAALVDLLSDAAAPRGDSASCAFVERLLDAARSYRPADFEQTLTLAIALLPPAQLVSEVLAPLLHDVGERWRGGEFAIAQERLVSGGVRRLVGAVLQSFEHHSHGEPIVFATLSGERHELGLLMAATVCASRGCRVHVLGTDVPPRELARFAREISARIIAVSLVMPDALAGVPAQLDALARDMAPGSAIWIGGSASRDLPRGELPAACVVIHDQLELERRLELLRAA